ncbi:hypothetical protein E4U53_008049, partial [Claviceps sorghi]
MLKCPRLRSDVVFRVLVKIFSMKPSLLFRINPCFFVPMLIAEPNDRVPVEQVISMSIAAGDAEPGLQLLIPENSR